jgi:hypothetical protein
MGLRRHTLLTLTILLLALSSCRWIVTVGAARLHAGGVARHDTLVSVDIDGYVRGPDGRPITDAQLRLWGSALEGEAATDQAGYFSLNASTRENECTLYALFDDPETPGVDLLPVARAVETPHNVVARVNFTMTPAATIVLLGQLRRVEVAKDLTRYMFKVVDPGGSQVLCSESLPLVYGTDQQARSLQLGLDASTLVVPASTPLAIRVTPASGYVGEQDPFWWAKPEESTRRHEAFTEFTLWSGEGLTLDAGEVLKVDLEERCLRADLEIVGQLAGEVEAKIEAVEKMGFYSASERHELGSSRALMQGVVEKMEGGVLEGCYYDLRQAYLKLLGVGVRMVSMRGEAALSVNALIFFTSVASVALATLLTESRGRRALLSVSVYAPLTLYLHRVYPGSGIVSPWRFLGIGALSFVAVLFAVDALPRAIGLGRGGVPGVGALVAVFSMAKRGLRRRRLRSLLTSSSILALTMSFVALTSLSTGYGLIHSLTGSRPPDASGIMVRMPAYEPENQFQNGWFNFVIPSVAEWAEGSEGVIGVSTKAENIPETSPLESLQGWPIRGVLGVEPDVEPLMPMIDASVEKGEPLREEGTCLVHGFMLVYAGVELGDLIAVRGVEMRVVGVFGDEISGVTDMDGEPLLPKYQNIMNPWDERPLQIVSAVTCEPETVLVTTLGTAQMIRGVHSSRIDISLAPEADPDVVGRSMAVSRGYRFWISSGGRVHFAQMGTWLAGRGLPVLVPWAIAVLNVVATMLSSMYERRREIDILSSIGLNPGHIAGVFLGEASILGVIGGGFGYLLGLGWYPLMSRLAIAPVVGQKVSAVWCIAALGIAVASVLTGSLLALLGSAGLTPSLRRKWSQDRRADGPEGRWETKLPLILGLDELEGFVQYVVARLEAQRTPGAVPMIGLVRRNDLEGGGVEVSFVYNEPNAALGLYRTTNSIRISQEPLPGRPLFSATLVSEGRLEAASRTGLFVRELLIQWSTERKRVESDLTLHHTRLDD